MNARNDADTTIDDVIMDAAIIASKARSAFWRAVDRCAADPTDPRKQAAVIRAKARSDAAISNWQLIRASFQGE